MGNELDRAIHDILELTEPLFHVPVDRRHEGDAEVKDVLDRRTLGQVDRFLKKWGRRPEEMVTELLESYLRSKGEERFAVVPRPLIFNGQVDTDIGARVRLKGRDPGRVPFLYLCIGTPFPPVRRVVEFGLRFGPQVEDDSACVQALNEPAVREQIDRALAENLDMTSVYGSDLALEDDDDAHITQGPCWGRRAAFSVGYSKKDLPNDLTAKIVGSLDSLWEPFLRSSLT
jgi:hypothetical protein